MDTEKKWTRVEGVAEHLDVKDTIYRWIKERDFPSPQAGNILCFNLFEMDEWVRQDSGQEKT